MDAVKREMILIGENAVLRSKLKKARAGLMRLANTSPVISYSVRERVLEVLREFES